MNEHCHARWSAVWESRPDRHQSLGGLVL